MSDFNWDEGNISIARLVITVRIEMDSLVVPQMVTMFEPFLAIRTLKSRPDTAFEAQMPR